MLLFAHAGITLGAAALIAGAVTQVRKRAAAPETRLRRPPFAAWFERLGRWVDIRILLVGALLPDIIDKPLELLMISSGRGYAHSLIFSLLLTFGGILLYLGRRRTWLLALAFGSLCHLLLDSMWGNPRTLFWPLYTWVLPADPRTDWTALWSEFLKNRGIELSEAVGLIVLLSFVLVPAFRKKLTTFLKKGRF